MLQHLKIKNLALLEAVTLEFESGFTVVTGETGAGKSVLLGALALLSGARTDKSMVRQGQDLLEVEAALYFNESEAINHALEAAGLPACEEGVLLLQRSVHRSKMPRIRINGSMATLAQLQDLGELWVDFHGPGEPQKLFQEKRQLEMLDSYAGNQDALIEFQAGYSGWREQLRAIEALRGSEQLDADELEFVQKQIRKIDSVDVSEASIEALELEYSRMSGGQELVAIASECSEGLIGEQSVNDQLGAIVGAFENLVQLDAGSGELLSRARSLQIELQDLGEEVGRLAGEFNFDPEAVEATTERMNRWQELRRKYGGSVEAVLSKREELAQKVELQGDIAGTLARKQKEADGMESQLRAQAAQLSKARKQAAAKLAPKVAKLLQALGFKKAQLKIELIAEPSLKPTGDSRCEFLFSPNAGQDLLPLNKIASSGETARVMLALKTVLAEADATPLLVFDEVDANVGGEVGRAVGAELARLAKEHQVLCVTHLPQVASLGHNHLVVSKEQSQNATLVEIAPLAESREARLEEIARMLGDRKSASARAHAEELLG